MVVVVVVVVVGVVVVVVVVVGVGVRLASCRGCRRLCRPRRGRCRVGSRMSRRPVERHCHELAGHPELALAAFICEACESLVDPASHARRPTLRLRRWCKRPNWLLHCHVRFHVRRDHRGRSLLLRGPRGRRTHRRHDLRHELRQHDRQLRRHDLRRMLLNRLDHEPRRHHLIGHRFGFLQRDRRRRLRRLHRPRLLRRAGRIGCIDRRPRLLLRLGRGRRLGLRRRPRRKPH